MRKTIVTLILSSLISLTVGLLAYADPTLINGAGATFPYPIYSKWFSEYGKVNTSVNFNYQSIGSGGGIRQILAMTVDFGATDGPMKDEQLKEAKGEILHLPTVLGGVVAVYNIPGISEKISFTQNALANIFLGKITKWNDPELQKANSGIKLPDKPIVVVHRSDGSGTTYIWVDFLSKVSKEWADKVGKNTSVNWPVGIGGKGNEGVSGLVKQTPFSIGYVEYGYAEHNDLSHGRIQNKNGGFVDCTDATVTKAASIASKNMPEDFRVSITNPSGNGVYPVSSFTWLLVYREQTDSVKGEALIGFLKWMLQKGQQYASSLGYAPLPEEVIKLEEAALNKIKVRSKLAKNEM